MERNEVLRGADLPNRRKVPSVYRVGSPVVLTQRRPGTWEASPSGGAKGSYGIKDVCVRESGGDVGESTRR